MTDRTISRPFDVALILGRFQTFHKGHENLINTALSVADRAVILIGSAQESGTVSNPFPVLTRQEMIRAIYPGNEVMISSIVDLNENKEVDDKWAKHVLGNVIQLIRKVPDVYLHGQEAQHTNWFRTSPSIIDSTKHMTEITVARERINISASTLRNYMFKDEFQKWSEFVNPKLHKYYDNLRKQLLLAPGMKDLVREKLKVPPEAWSDGRY